MGNKNSDALVISFDAKEGLKALENNIMDAMDGISNEMQKKLEDAFAKAGKNPRLKKQLTGVYQGLFDDLTKSAGNLDESNKAIDRFVGKIDYLGRVINKTRKDGKVNQGLLDGLSIKDMDAVLKGYDEVLEAEEKIRKYESADFKENKRSETTVKSLKELEKAYGKVGKAQEEYAEKVNTYLKSAGVETSSISKEIKEYSSLLALFEKINSTKITSKDLESNPDAAIKKSQALLYVMQQITDLEKGNKLLGKFRIDESEIKNLKSSVTILSQQVEGSISDFVKGITTGLKSEISNILVNAVEEAKKASQHQFISAQKTQAKIGIGSGSGTGDAKGDIKGVGQAAQNAQEDVNNLSNALNNLGGGKGSSSNELDLWESSAKNLGKEFENVIGYAKSVEKSLERVNELLNSRTSLSKDETIEALNHIQRLYDLENDEIWNNGKATDFYNKYSKSPIHSKQLDAISEMTKAQLAEIEKLKAAKKEVSDQPISRTVNKVDGTEEAVEATARLTEAEKEASEQAEKLEKELSDAGGISKEKIEQLTSAINELKEKSQVAIDVVIDNAVANTNTIKDKINELPDKKEIEIRVKDFSDMPYLTDPKTGKPLTLYRGTREAISGTVGADQNGLSYYSTDRRVAESYIAQHGGKLITANGAMKNPLEIDVEGSRWNNLTYIGEGFDEVSKKLWNLKDSISKYREDLGKLKKDSSEYKEVSDKLNSALEEQKKILADTSNPYVMNATTDEFADKVKASGLYDGLILKNIIDGGGITATDVVFFDEQQIRNAQVLNSELDKTVQKKEEIASVDKTQVDSTTTTQIETQQKLQAELEETKQQAKETTTALSDGNQTLSDSNQVVKAQDKIQEELRETREEAEKTNAVLSESNQKDILSSPTQKFDNDLQKDLVYLENYKNTIEEINKLKLEPQTDETERKLKELQKLADYFFGSISITQSEWNNDGANFSDYYGTRRNDLSMKGYGESAKEIFKIGKEIQNNSEKLNIHNLTSEFSGISEEISRIELKSESLRNSLTKDLLESTNYVKKLSSAFTRIADSQEELKTETDPTWIKDYNETIDKALSKFPELIQFKDKFTTLKSAKQFTKTSEWNDFLATLPQAKAYLESIGYEFKEIAQAQSHQNGILSGTENTPEIKKESEAVEELTNSYKELSSIKDLQAQKKGGNYSQVLVDGLSDAMVKMKAFYDAGQTESLEYYAVLSRIANIQKEMWTYSGGGKTAPADQLSQSNKDYDDRLSMQDSILQDFMQFKSTTNDVVDFVIQQFSDMRHNVKGSFSGLFDDTGKILSQKVREQVSDMFEPIGNQTEVLSGSKLSDLQAQEKIYLRMASSADLVGKSHAEIKQLLIEEDKNGGTINKDLRDRILLLENGRVVSEANAEAYKDAYQTESLLGKTQQEVLSILQKENAEIEEGNRLFRERMIYFKDGVVVQEVLGDSKRVNGSYDASVGANEFLHTHPTGKLNQLFSVEDLYAFYDEFSKGLKQFSVLSGNKLSRFNLSSLDFDSYDKFVDQYILLMQSVESQFKNFADKGTVPSDKFETVVNNFQRVISKYITDTFGNLGTEFRTFKVDDMGNISNSMPSPLTNKLRDTIFEVSKFLESVYDKIHQGELSVEEAEKQLDAFTAKKFQKVISERNQTPLSSPTLFEDESGQLSFVEQIQKTNGLIEEESGQMAMFKIESEKATDSAIEGQMTLNDYIDKNIEGQMTLNDLLAKETVSNNFKYQNLLDQAKLKIDNDSSNYYSKNVPYEALGDFIWTENAKRHNNFNSFENQYLELSDSIDKIRKNLEKNVIGFDEAIEQLISSYKKFDSVTKTDVGGFDFLNKATFQSDNKVGEKAKETAEEVKQANDKIVDSNEEVIASEKAKDKAVSDNASASVSKPIKDTFDANKEASEMEKVATTAEEAAQSKKDFATANEGVQASVDGSKSKLQLEAELMDSIAKSAREAAEAKKEFAKANELVQQSVDNTQNATKNDKYKDKTKVSDEEYTAKSNQYASIANQKLLSNGYTILGESVNTELVDGLVKVSAKIKTAEGAWKTFSAKIDADGNMFEQRFRTITKNVDKLEQELASFGQANVSSSSGVDKIIEAYETLAKTELDFQKLKAKSSTKRGLTIDEADKLSKLEQIRAEANQTLKQQTDLTEEQTQASKRYANELERVQSLMSRNVVSKEKQALEKMWTDYNRISTNKKDFSYDANYERELDALKSQLKELDGLAENLQFVDDKDIEKFAELRQSAEQALNAIKEKTGNLKFKTPDVADVRKKMNEIQKIMEQNTRMPKDMKDTFEALKRKYQLLIDTKGSVSQFKSLNGELEELVLKLRESGKTGKSFFSTVGAQLKSMNSRLLAYYFSMYDFIRYARYAINAVVELDNALLDLKKTTTMTDQQLESFYYTSNDIAKKMGVTTAQIVEQASAWSRLGYSSEEAATTMAQLSSQFASISPGMETDQAQEGLVSIMKANIYCLNVQRCA